MQGVEDLDFFTRPATEGAVGWGGFAAVAVLCHARLGDRFQVGSRRSYARGCTTVVYGVRPEWPKSLPTDIPQRIRQAANSFFNSVQVQQRITHHQAG